MKIAILLYENFTALDAIGPYEVLSRLPEAQVCFAARERGPMRTDTGSLGVLADYTLDELPTAEILLIPGGPGSDAAGDDGHIVDWIRKLHTTSRWTTSVCTGSLILAAAGVLEGVEATTHWAFHDRLRELGANPVEERVVERGKIMTAAGVSSGIDMALRLAEHEAGTDFARALQLGIEYDPDPPFDCGSPSKAPPALVELVRSTMRPKGA